MYTFDLVHRSCEQLDDNFNVVKPAVVWGVETYYDGIFAFQDQHDNLPCECIGKFRVFAN